jgi:phosphoesterase RecJ-like protein
MEHLLATLKAPFIMIDHHQNQMIMLHSLILILFGSTCEMIYISSSWKKKDIDKTIGTCIYTGILTDSGSFRFPKQQEQRTELLLN